MPRHAKPLSARKVETAPPGRHYDGDGLHLWIRAPALGWWVFRYAFHGRTREAGLGRARGRNAVSLAEARTRAGKMRTMLRDGIDPLAARDAERAKAKEAEAKVKATSITFHKVAGHYLAAHEASWKNPKHRQQWRHTLRDYVLPAVGKLPVAAIGTSEVMQIVEPIWHQKPETASRVRGRIESILDYATARHWRDGANPARWKGHLANLLPARSKVRAVEHHAAIPWREIGAFTAKLREQSSISAECLEFAVLTAARSAEARGGPARTRARSSQFHSGVASPAGFEPTAPGLGILCSIRLSYGDIVNEFNKLLPSSGAFLSQHLPPGHRRGISCVSSAHRLTREGPFPTIQSRSGRVTLDAPVMPRIKPKRRTGGCLTGLGSNPAEESTTPLHLGLDLGLIDAAPEVPYLLGGQASFTSGVH